jgi:hypothetical protein
MYIAESLCMLGRFEESFTHLEMAEGFSSQGIVKQVELKFRTINVSRQSDEKISEEIITKLNKCVIHICAGQFDTARQKLDEIITGPEESGGLGIKEITCETDQMLPAYLITLLTYFYLRTKNLKMARSLIKSRRFVVDSDHLVQQLRQAPPGPAASGQTKYAKKPVPLMNYKSISKNFS